MSRNALQSVSQINEATAEILEGLQQSIQPWVTALLTRAPGENSSHQSRTRLVQNTILPIWKVIQSMCKDKQSRYTWYSDLEYRINIVRNLYSEGDVHKDKETSGREHPRGM